MKLIFISFIIYFIFFCSSIVAKTIAVVNIQTLIDNNLKYIETLELIEISQLTFLEEFKIKEENLKKMLDDIENSKLILSDNEINNLINEYNVELSNFSLKVDEFNYHYQNQIIKIREKILEQIIVLLEDYAKLNKIDLILDSTSYLIASNSLDITDDINIKLKSLKINLNYEEFEKN